MENENIQNGIKEIKNIKMTQNEKENILKSVLNFSLPQKPIKSPYSFVSIFQRNHFAYYLAVFCLIMVLGGGEIYFNNQAGQKTGNLATIQNPRETSGIGQENLNIQNRDFGKNITNPSKNSTSYPVGNPSQGIPNPVAMMAPTMGGVKANPDYTDIASVIFTDWLKKEAAQNGGLLDYKINKIDFIVAKINAEGQDLSYFGADTTKDAFIVSVNYSVQSTPENIIYWEAGNGTIGTDGWILNKSLFVTIDKNSNGYYVENAGTGL